MSYNYDEAELLHRASRHPVAGPILEIIARDLIIEAQAAKIEELEGREPDGEDARGDMEAAGG